MRIPAKSLAVVMARSSGRCEVCGAPGTQTHHRIPGGMGGSRDPSHSLPGNLLRICLACHDFAHREVTVARDLGLLVRRGQNSTEVPVQLFIPGVLGWDLPALCRVRLTDDGQYVLRDPDPRLAREVLP